MSIRLMVIIRIPLLTMTSVSVKSCARVKVCMLYHAPWNGVKILTNSREKKNRNIR